MIDRSWLLVCGGVPQSARMLPCQFWKTILDNFWTTRNLYINNSSQFGPKKILVLFWLWAAIRHFMFCVPTLCFSSLQPPPSTKNRLKTKNKAFEVQKHKRAMKPWWSQPNQKNGPFQYISKTIVIYVSVEFRVLHFPDYLNGIPWSSIPFKGVDVWGKGLHNQWNDT